MTATQMRTQPRFVGVADWWGRRVWVEQGPTRRMLRQAGDDRLVGFAWGRRGLGTRQLAEAMLADATGNPMLAQRLSRDLAIDIVAELDGAGFELATEDVLDWVDRQADAA